LTEAREQLEVIRRCALVNSIYARGGSIMQQRISHSATHPSGRGGGDV